MKEHPINSLMEIAMNNIQEMIDVNTIIGETIYINENISIIPISKVSFGFAAGGSEFKGESIEEYKKRDKDEEIVYTNPFGGGSGAGVSISPIAFLVVQEESVKLLHIDNDSPVDKLLDYIPDIIEKVSNIIEQKNDEEKETESLKEIEEQVKEKN